MNALSSLIIPFRIKTENDAGNLAPVGALGISIEQPQIGDFVGQIIVGDLVRYGRLIQKSGCVQGFLAARFIIAEAGSI